jgi:hypothetical protein
MLPALFLATAAILAPEAPSVTLSLPDPVPGELELLARATPTRFLAINATAHTELLVFADAHGPLAQLVLAPGGLVDASFPEGTLDGMYFEVVVFDPAGWRKSGALELNRLDDEGVDALSIEVGATRSNAWLLDPSGRAPLNPVGELMPPSFDMLCAPPYQPLVIDPMHVPVPMPVDTRQGDVAPKLNPSLPPV